jgi:tetratricopeptide (TPR) repeat protein
MEKNQFSDAEKNLREAISYDPKLPQSYYQLGRVLDAMNRGPDALTALKQAVTLDSNYPDPHYLLGRIYRRSGENQLAKTEADRFQILKKDSASPLNSQPRNIHPHDALRKLRDTQ